MRSLPLSAAIVAVLAVPAAHADMVVIQQGPLPVGFAHMQHMPMPSGVNPAIGFVQNLAATRMPDLLPAVPYPVASVLYNETEEPLADPISFAGDWALIEVRGLTGDMMALPDDRIETTHFTIDEMGLFDASAGCNPIVGVAALDDGLLTIEAELEHQMMCFVGMEFEYPLEVALNATALFAQGPETLVLLDAEGNKLARFAAL